MQEVTLQFDSWCVADLKVITRCPDCNNLMQTRDAEQPFSVTSDFAVIPLECPKCKFGTLLHLYLEKEQK